MKSRQILCVLLGGRSAEKIFYNEVSSGAFDDIEKITNLIEHYYKSWGMSKFGPINFNKLKVKDDSNLIDSIMVSIKKLEDFTLNTILENKSQIELLSNKLLDKETIDYTDIKNTLDNSIENSVVASLD